MLKKAIAVGALTVLTTNLFAGFPGDFQKAADSYRNKKFQEAHEAFLGLSEKAPTPDSKAECLRYAAVSLGRQKKYEQAMELAKSIKPRSMAVYAQMEIMSVNRKHKELTAAFKEEEINAWPDKINYKGFSLRGNAYRIIKDHEAAIKDFEQCAELAGSDIKEKLRALDNAASAYKELKNDEKAMDIYLKVFDIYEKNPSMKGYYLFPHALLGTESILKKQGKYEEALIYLNKYKFKDKKNAWDCLILEAYGDIYLAQGKNDKAMDKYKEASSVKTHKSYIDRINKKIENLKKQNEGEAK